MCLFAEQLQNTRMSRHMFPSQGFFYPFHDTKERQENKAQHLFTLKKKNLSYFYSLKREKICPVPFLPLDGSYLKSEK